MSKKLLKNLLPMSLAVLALTGNGFAQTTENPLKKVNFSYSQNPKIKERPDSNKNKGNSSNGEKKVAQPDSKTASKENLAVNNENASSQEAVDKTASNAETANASIAKKTLEIAKKASAEAVSPTEVYKIGVGDILFISLQNAPPNSSTYFTVLNDGTIDYPLAGQMVSVAGLTTEEVEDLLKEKIKLFENPQVAVKVREPASHSITVLGLVEKAGEKFLPREAMPLYYVRAEAIVQSKANQAVIKHSNSGSETIDLNDSKSDNVLIFPGDIIEFKFADDKKSESRQPQFFYIGGDVMSVGQKDFYQGLTLTQAILVSGGLRRTTIKKAIIRRKNAEGLLVATEVNLKAVNEGKEPDPLLEAGDTIEVKN